MVDSISGKNPNIQDAGLLGVNQQQSSQSVEKVNVESAKETAALGSVKLLDEATISDEAKKAYESEKEVLRLSRLAQRVQEPYDAEKVAQMKNLLDNGRINEYLRSLNTEAIAESILNSPSGAFLQ
jgi:predicted lipid-binding transport protein (Tim44 family)